MTKLIPSNFFRLHNLRRRAFGDAMRTDQPHNYGPRGGGWKATYFSEPPLRIAKAPTRTSISRSIFVLVLSYSVYRFRFIEPCHGTLCPKHCLSFVAKYFNTVFDSYSTPITSSPKDHVCGRLNGKVSDQCLLTERQCKCMHPNTIWRSRYTSSVGTRDREPRAFEQPLLYWSKLCP